VKPLEGILPVLVVPFDDRDEVDHGLLADMARLYVERGVHGLTILGSNSEFVYLTPAEQEAVLATVVRAAGGRVPVVAGVGARGTREACDFARRAADLGADALLVALHVYYPVRPAQVALHLRAVGRAGGRPVIYYHFPATTHLRLRPAEVIDLVAADGVAGIKESVLSLPEIRAHLEDPRVRAKSVFSGNTFMLPGVFKAGGKGAICPVPLLAPALVVELYEKLRAGDHGRAREIHERLLALLPIFSLGRLPPKAMARGFAVCVNRGIPMPGRGGDPVHAAVKEALRLLGLPITPRVRNPLPPLHPAHAERVARAIAAAGVPKLV
jgi:dihydrodipicolinate synthase/N-acetylneuraminate lyase